MHPGQIDIDETTARRRPEAGRLLSRSPDIRIMRNDDIAWLNPLPTFEGVRQDVGSTGQELLPKIGATLQLIRLA